MSDLIKKIKIKKQDGTFTDYIPIGAEAENVNVDGESVEIKLNKKPYYYNNVADMKADTKLKAGDMAVTLGYYELNDGGGAEYRIVKTSDKYIEDLDNSLKAELIAQDKINVKQLGAYGDGIHNDSAIIQMAINNFNYISFSKGTYGINNTIRLQNLNNKIIDGAGSKFYNLNINSTTDFMFTIAQCNNIIFQNLDFDWNNDSGNLCFWITKSIITIKNSIFQNFYQHSIPTDQSPLIRVNQGGHAILDKLIFKNIIGKSNGVITDGPGALRMILSTYTLDYPLDEEEITELDISNIIFEECYTVDQHDELIMDDCDCICLQGYNKTLLYTNINNIVVKNAGKRFLKIQNNNCNINNIALNYDDNYSHYMTCAIEAHGGENMWLRNINVSNVTANLGSVSCLSFVHAFNVSVANVNTIANHETNIDYGKHGIGLYGVNNISISNCNFRNVGWGLAVLDNSEDIYISDCNFKDCTSGAIWMETRTVQDWTARNITIKNVHLNNCLFAGNSSNIDTPFLLIKQKTDTNGIIDGVYMNNCTFDFDTYAGYIYFLIRIIATNVQLINSIFKMKNIKNTQYAFSNPIDLKMINCQCSLLLNDGSDADRPCLIASDAGQFYLDHCTFNSSISISNPNVFGTLERCNYTTINYSGGASANQITII